MIPETVPADLSTVFHQLSLEGRLAGFEATERFYEIGSPSGLRDFESYVAEIRDSTLNHHFRREAVGEACCRENGD
jgi:hypothetical protein